MMASSCDDVLDPGYVPGAWNLCPENASTHCPMCLADFVEPCPGIFACPTCRTAALWRHSPWDESRWEILLCDELAEC